MNEIKNDKYVAITDQSRGMTLTYTISLAVIASLSIFVHLMLDQIIEEQTDTATVINISGEQRMLSQRSSLFAIEYLSAGDNEAKQAALVAINAMQKNHRTLLSKHFSSVQNTQESPLSEAMHQLYFAQPHNIDKQIEHYVDLIKDALNLDISERTGELADTDMSFVAMAKTPLLNGLNTVVKQYEIESLEKVSNLRKAQQVVFMIIILTILIEALFIFRPMVAKVSRFTKRLQQEAEQDHLTGLLNRRSFGMLAEKNLTLAIRYKHPLSVITFDIDDFKSVNDTYGHDVGDKVIQHVSRIIKNNSRGTDCVARFGGEEFVVMLPQTSSGSALLLAETIRQKIENSPLELKQLIIKITISGGVSGYQIDEKGINVMLKRSDHAMYQAKEAGRNKICHA